MTGRPKNKPRKFRGFAVIERPAGALVWGTFRPTEDAARAAFSGWNPSTTGAELVAVEVTVFDIGRENILSN